MKLQLLSDLHLETEAFDPEPAPGAEVLVLAGDIDATWAGLSRFAGWPVPVLFVPGNHEFDGRAFAQVLPALRERCDGFGIHLLHRQSLLVQAADGMTVRFVGVVRWSDFDLFGAAGRQVAIAGLAVGSEFKHGKFLMYKGKREREDWVYCRKIANEKRPIRAILGV